MLINIVQRSQEWLEFRRTRITATDFCVIAANNELCNNLFNKSLNQLISDKLTGHLLPDNKYFALGRKYEPILLEKINGVNIICNEIITYDKNDRIMASLDARDSFVDKVIEIKTTSKSYEHLDKQIEYYQFQVAHQCYVSGCNIGMLVIGFLDYAGELLKIEQIEIDPKKVIIKKKWLFLCNEFLATLDDAHKCPSDTLSLWEQYKSIDEQIKSLESLKTTLKNDLVQKHPNGVVYKEFSITKSIKNTIKYGGFIKSLNLDVPNEFKGEFEFFIIKEK